MPQPPSTIDLLALEPAQKLDLITQLWDSLPNTADAISIPEWHQQVIEQRLAAADAEPDAGIPWEQVRARLREGL